MQSNIAHLLREANLDDAFPDGEPGLCGLCGFAGAEQPPNSISEKVEQESAVPPSLDGYRRIRQGRSKLKQT
jgi:hypothetical protein